MERGGCTYILTNANNSVLYVGVTSELYNRVYDHRTKVFENSFTSRYNLNKLVWYRAFSRIEEAIDYEKYLKGKKRSFKEKLINETNPFWRDLWNDNL